MIILMTMSLGGSAGSGASAGAAGAGGGLLVGLAHKRRAALMLLAHRETEPRGTAALAEGAAVAAGAAVAEGGLTSLVTLGR